MQGANDDIPPDAPWTGGAEPKVAAGVNDQDATRARSGTELRAAIEALARRPLEDQFAEHRDAALRRGIDETEIALLARVVVTLEKPVPVTVATSLWLSETRYELPSSVTSVSLFGTMPDGHPYAIDGHPDVDLLGILEGFVRRANESGRVDYDPSTIRTSTVITGFSLSMDDYAKVSEAIGESFGPYVAFVTLDQRPTALKPVEPLSAVDLDYLERSYRNEEVG